MVVNFVRPEMLEAGMNGSVNGATGGKSTWIAIFHPNGVAWQLLLPLTDDTRLTYDVGNPVLVLT